MTAAHPVSPRSGAPMWRRALVWLVGAGLLGWLLSSVPMAMVVSALERPSLGTWALTLTGLALSYGVRAARLQVVMGLESDAQASRRWLGLRLDALRVILMHNAAVNLLPMRAGELSFPYLAATVLRMPVHRAVASLLWMRLQDLAVLACLGLLCWPGLPLAGRAAGVVGVVLAWHGCVHLLDRIQQGASPDSDNNAPRWRTIVRRLHQALLEPHHHHWATWLFTWANWTIKLSAGAWLIAAITEAAMGPSWAGALGGELAAIVPVQGPAGFGTYEAGVWAGLSLTTGPQSPFSQAGIAAALALHLCFLCCAVMAGALAWATGARLTDLTPASAPRNPD